MLNHVRIAFIPMSVSGVSRYGCHAINHVRGHRPSGRFRILWILLLIAGFKLTGMFINENMNANHVNIIRNMLIKLSESCQHAANHANTIVPVPVMSVIVA